MQHAPHGGAWSFSEVSDMLLGFLILCLVGPRTLFGPCKICWPTQQVSFGSQSRLHAPEKCALMTG
jgi:hypothetical protein